MRTMLSCICICLGITGCGTLQTSTVETINTALPRQPIGYTQDLGNRDPYTGSLPYVLCFGDDCDRPTPKNIVRKPVAQQVNVVAPEAVSVKETHIKESIEFLFNTTEINPDSKPTLESVVRSAMGAKEILIKGMAGLTDTNREKENAVMSLALSRAKYIESHMKKAGVSAYTTVGSELVRCKSEDDCLQRFKYGGRRADLEIVIISGGKSVEQRK